MRRGVVEYVIVTGLVLLTVTFGSVAMLAFESRVNPDLN